MNQRTLGILTIVVLLLGGYVYWDSQREAGPTVIDQSEDGSLPEPVATDVPRRPFEGATIETATSLQIVVTSGMTTTQFVQEEGAWFQTVPTQTALIDGAIVTQLTGLINMSTQRTFAEGLNPIESYGLDAPQYEISLAFTEGEFVKRRTLFVGNALGTADAYYMQVKGTSQVYVISSAIVDSLLELAENPPLPIAEPTPVSIEG